MTENQCIFFLAPLAASFKDITTIPREVMEIHGHLPLSNPKQPTYPFQGPSRDKTVIDLLKISQKHSCQPKLN